MNRLTYNAALLVGVALVGAGVAMLSVAAALTVVGALVIALTIVGAWLESR